MKKAAAGRHARRIEARQDIAQAIVLLAKADRHLNYGRAGRAATALVCAEIRLLCAAGAVAR